MHPDQSMVGCKKISKMSHFMSQTYLKNLFLLRFFSFVKPLIVKNRGHFQVRMPNRRRCNILPRKRMNCRNDKRGISRLIPSHYFERFPFNHLGSNFEAHPASTVDVLGNWRPQCSILESEVYFWELNGRIFHFDSTNQTVLTRQS